MHRRQCLGGSIKEFRVRGILTNKPSILGRIYKAVYEKRCYLRLVGRDSSVSTAPPYGLDGPGTKSRWRRNFPNPSKLALRSNQPPIQQAASFFSPGVKRPGHGINHPPPSSVEVKERVELYLYSPSGPSWPLLGRTFTFVIAFYTACLSAWTTSISTEHI
jgi:hypothetical protein